MAGAPLDPEAFPVLKPGSTEAQLRSLSYYQLLGVTTRSPAADIQTNYDLLALSCHPYVCQLPFQPLRFELLTEAYATLLDPNRRAAYDATQRRVPLTPARAGELFAPTEERWGEWVDRTAHSDPNGRPPLRVVSVARRFRSWHEPGGHGWLVTGPLSGAVFGATVAGPAGAVVGAAVGAAGGMWRVATGEHAARSFTAALARPETQQRLALGLGALLKALEPPPKDPQVLGGEAEATSTAGSAVSRSSPTTAEELAAIPCTKAEEGRGEGCKICLNNAVNSLLLPCRHVALCSECVAAVLRSDRKCPICRAPILDVHAPIFIS